MPAPAAGLSLYTPMVTCESASDLAMQVLRPPGVGFMSSGCVQSYGGSAWGPYDGPGPAGKPVSLTVRIGAPAKRDSSMPEPLPVGVYATIRIGRYVAVTPGDYVFPARPKGWTPTSRLNDMHWQYEDAPGFTPVLRQTVVSGDPDRAVEHRLAPGVGRYLEGVVDTVSPGIVTVRLDGKEVARCESWVWTPASCQISVDLGAPPPGAPRSRTLRVTGTGFTAPGWQLRISASRIDPYATPSR